MRVPVPVASHKPPLHPDALARFVDALPILRVHSPDGTRPDPAGDHAVLPKHSEVSQLPFYRVAMREVDVRVHRDVPPTRMWSYGDSVPGPTFEVRSGHPLLVEWRNDLPDRHFLPIDRSLCGADGGRPEVRTVVHVHGGRVPSASDGYPEDWYTPGQSAVFRYPNGQDAATLWYHDHAMGIERLNQYAGLFGFYIVRDDVEEALRLPSGPYEIPLVLSDRLFDADGALRYPTSGMPDQPWVSEFNGDAHLVNGKLFPYLEVEARAYRFRVLNASNSRFYALSMSNGQPFQQIGSDQGFLTAPVAVRRLTMAPAERADLIVDFSGSAGQDFVLQNESHPLMQFRVKAGPKGITWKPPARLRTVEAIPPHAAVKTRTLTLNEYADPKTHAMLMLLDAKRWREPVSERPLLGSVEIWSFVNLTEDSHPIHLHLVRFQILDRQQFDPDEYLTSGKMRLLGAPVRPTADEAGWKDTVRAEPGLVTRIIVRFDGYAGRYVWHCHVLEHAANEMMRPFEVIAG
jgi:spore coat protein A